MNASAPTGTVVARPSGVAVARFLVGTVAAAVLIVAAALTAFCLIGSVAPGWRATVVGSGSMTPGLAVGDVALVTETSNGVSQLPDPGTVVLVDRPGQVPLLHRVVGQERGLIVTKGDANLTRDSDLVDPSAVAGIGRIVIPWVGLPSLWFGAGNLLAGAVLVAVLGALSWLARFGWDERYDPWRTAPMAIDHDLDGTPGADAVRDSPTVEDRPRSAPPADRPARVLRGPMRGVLGSVATFVRVGALVLVIVAVTVGSRADAVFTGRSAYNAPTMTAAVLEPPTGLSARACESPADSPVTLRWTASASTFVGGYDILQDGAKVASASAQTTTFELAAPADTASYSVRATSRTWTSVAATAALERVACG